MRWISESIDVEASLCWSIPWFNGKRMGLVIFDRWRKFFIGRISSC